jgi:tetratricopeptide (TPR) repeat protein
LPDAKKHYEEALEKNPNNTIALRGLWLMAYDLGDLNKSLDYLNRLDTISRFHIFQPHMFDLKLQKILYKIYLKKWNIFWALKHFYLLTNFKAKNKKTMKKNYVL